MFYRLSNNPVFVLYSVVPGSKHIVAVFATNALAVAFAQANSVPGWHVQSAAFYSGLGANAMPKPSAPALACHCGHSNCALCA